MRRSTRRSQEKHTSPDRFECTHAHGGRICHLYLKECDRKCKHSGSCSHCINYFIPMSQKLCRGCAGLERRNP